MNDDTIDKIAKRHAQAMEHAAWQKRMDDRESVENMVFDRFLSLIASLKQQFRDETKALEVALKNSAGATSLADTDLDTIRVKYTDQLDSIMEQNPAADYELAYQEKEREIKEGEAKLAHRVDKEERDDLEYDKEKHRKSKAFRAHKVVEDFRKYIDERENFFISNFGSASEKTALRQRRLNNTQSSETSPSRPSVAQSNKQGVVRKCPACGATTESLAARCSACGHEFRGLSASSSVQALAETLSEIAEECERESSDGETFEDTDKDKRRRRSLMSQAIKNHPVPSTREDIFELLFFINSKTQWGSHAEDNVLIPAWQAKESEVISKGRFILRNDKDALDELSKIEKRRNKLGLLEQFRIWFAGTSITTKLAGVMLCCVLIFSYIIISSKLTEKKEQERLTQLVLAIERSIEAKEYDKALYQATQLQWPVEHSSDKAKVWDERRKEIIQQIEALKNKR